MRRVGTAFGLPSLVRGRIVHLYLAGIAGYPGLRWRSDARLTVCSAVAPDRDRRCDGRRRTGCSPVRRSFATIHARLMRHCRRVLHGGVFDNIETGSRPGTRPDPSPCPPEVSSGIESSSRQFAPPFKHHLPFHNPFPRAQARLKIRPAQLFPDTGRQYGVLVEQRGTGTGDGHASAGPCRLLVAGAVATPNRSHLAHPCRAQSPGSSKVRDVRSLKSTSKRWWRNCASSPPRRCRCRISLTGFFPASAKNCRAPSSR